jgi:uncharacterized pyridoxal phosphate-containing UPF0001 family protein
MKLAEKLSIEQEKMKKNVKYFIQVNFENEKQKGGMLENEIKDFLNFCKLEKKLNVIGLMCIPPVDKPPEIYFKKLQFLAKTNNLSELSMGMSGDYLKAIDFGSSFIRIGSLIFGDRK